MLIDLQHQHGMSCAESSLAPKPKCDCSSGPHVVVMKMIIRNRVEASVLALSIIWRSGVQKPWPPAQSWTPLPALLLSPLSSAIVWRKVSQLQKSRHRDLLV